MKNITCILVSALLLIGCSKQRATMNLLLDNAERAIEINPDSAQILLDSIPASEKLKDKSFARWCMLSGKITDLIYNALLPAEQFERAYEWYSTHGTPTEKVICSISPLIYSKASA